MKSADSRFPRARGTTPARRRGGYAQIVAAPTAHFPPLGADPARDLPHPRQESADEALLALLNHAGERANANSVALAEGAPSAVKQHHMESGDIELF